MRKCLALAVMACLLLTHGPALGEAVSGAEGVARIAETGVVYPALFDALIAAESGGTIEVLGDIDLGATLEIAKPVSTFPPPKLPSGEPSRATAP